MVLTGSQTKKLELVTVCFEQFNDLNIIPNARGGGSMMGEYNAP